MTNWSAARSAVALEALSMAPETTTASVCPVCNGGQSGEKKLSVTRTHNGALFVCFRAACGFRGFVAIGEGGSKDHQRRPKPARLFNGETEFHPTRAARILVDYKGFGPLSVATLKDWGLSWSSDGRVYECRGFRGEVLGHVTRSPDKVVRTYRAREGGDMYAVYRVDGAPLLGAVLVEDSISGMCVASHGWAGITLLGTNVPPAVEEWISGTPAERRIPLLVFLDPDAESKSIEIASRYRGAKAVIGYNKDPKDLPDLGKILASYL